MIEYNTLAKILLENPNVTFDLEFDGEVVLRKITSKQLVKILENNKLITNVKYVK